MELQVGYLKLKMQGCSPLEQQQCSALRGNFLPLGSDELLIVFIVCLCIKCCASLHPFYKCYSVQQHVLHHPVTLAMDLTR